MAASLTIRTHASAPDTTIVDEGVVVPGATGSATFVEVARISRLQASQSLLSLLTDDAYGAGQSTLILVDAAGNDVLQGFVSTFLSWALEDVPGIGNKVGDLMYVGRSQTYGASEAAAVWQIYRHDVLTKVTLWADGDAEFDNIWANHLTLSYS